MNSRICPRPECGELEGHASHRRGSRQQQGYGAAWRAIRQRILRRDPICRDESGCSKKSVDVDHIVSRRNGGTDFDDNLQGLCRSHHSAKTVREDVPRAIGYGAGAIQGGRVKS